MDLKAQKTCKDCSNTDEYALTKTEAAFSLKEKFITSQPCTQCGSISYMSYSWNRPGLDKELLDIWGNNPNLYFLGQDEEIILAEKENIPLFLFAINANLYTDKKLNILLNALCLLAYDNIINPQEYTESENGLRKMTADKIIPELYKRKHLLINLGWEIMPYIKKVIFPLIDINYEPGR